MPCGITQCHLPPGRDGILALTQGEAGTRFRRDARLNWLKHCSKGAAIAISIVVCGEDRTWVLTPQSDALATATCEEVNSELYSKLLRWSSMHYIHCVILPHPAMLARYMPWHCVRLCLCLYVSVCHKSEFYRNSSTNLPGFWLGSFLPPILSRVWRNFGYLQK